MEDKMSRLAIAAAVLLAAGCASLEQIRGTSPQRRIYRGSVEDFRRCMLSRHELVERADMHEVHLIEGISASADGVELIGQGKGFVFATSSPVFSLSARPAGDGLIAIEYREVRGSRQNLVWSLVNDCLGVPLLDPPR
jgi:hypothetical protein